MDKLLCVGGPRDGEQMTIGGEFTYAVAAVQKPFLPPPSTVAGTICYTRYVRQRWAGEKVLRAVLVPEGQTADETLDMLIGGYCANKS